MRVFVVSMSLLACSLCQANSQQRPKPGDALESGSVWQGTYNRVELMPNGKPGQLNTDGKLKITERNGKDFKGELWLLNGDLGMEVKGTASDEGAVILQFVREIQGAWRKDWIGKAKAKGSLQGKKLVINVTIPGQVFKATLRLEKLEETDFVRWESAIAAFEKSDKEKPPPINPVVFVGSSSIRLWDLSQSFPQMPALNRGFGGSQLADSVHFAPRIVLKYKPRLVVLYAGDNDLGADKTPERVFKDFQAFTKIVRDKLPKVRIVYISIKPSLLRWTLIDKIRQTNTLIEAECKKDERLIYLDVVTSMLGEDGKPRRELFAGDGLHLNAKGYALWAERLKPYLDADKTDAVPIRK